MDEIIVGTYEDYVVGYQAESLGKPGQHALEQSFAVRGHSGSVTNVAISENGRLAMSVGYDEMVNIFDLKKRKLLQTFESPIKCAAFVGSSHLICGCEDSHIYIYEYKSNEMILAKTLKGHKAAVTSLSVHPSGKVLLSLSKDNTMRTWNLIKGRLAFVTQVKPQAHLISWSLSGQHVLLGASNAIQIFNNSGNLEHNIKLDKRINSLEFITENIFLVANDSGKLEFIDLTKGVSLMKFDAHESRIKSVKRFGGAGPVTRFVTASSDGAIKLWQCDNPGKTEPRELANVSTGARLTCMTTASRTATHEPTQTG